MKEISEKKAIYMMVVCAVLWSTGGFLIKLVPWQPLAIAGFRSLFAACVFMVYFIKMRFHLVINRDTLLCGLMLSATTLLFVTANKLTTSANAIILQSTAPIFIMLLSVLLFGCRYRRIEYAMVLIVFIGIALFFFDDLDRGGLLGNLAGLASGVCMASMFLLSSRLPDDQSSQSALLMGMLMTALTGIPTIAISRVHFTPVSVGVLLLLGFFQLGLPYVLYGLAVRRCSPLSCSLIGMLEPLLNPIWVFFMVGELPGVLSLIGGAIVLITVTIWVWYGHRAARQQMPELLPETEQAEGQMMDGTEDLQEKTGIKGACQAERNGRFRKG